MGIDDCDDGNKISGDGCDSQCKVEKNWDCKYGTPLNKDICKYVGTVTADGKLS